MPIGDTKILTLRPLTKGGVKHMECENEFFLERSSPFTSKRVDLRDRSMHHCVSLIGNLPDGSHDFWWPWSTLKGWTLLNGGFRGEGASRSRPPFERRTDGHWKRYCMPDIFLGLRRTEQWTSTRSKITRHSF